MVQTISDLSMLLELIRLLPDSPHPNIVVISGFGGSGKSTLAHKLAENLDRAAIVMADDFMTKDYIERSDEWDCLDRKRIISQVLKPAEQGEIIKYEAFDWETHALGAPKYLDNPNYIILEGIGIIHPALRPYWDFAIWIDCTLETAMLRGMNRDVKVLHTDQSKLWREIWAPNDQDFFDKIHPSELADCQYDGEHPATVQA